MVDPFLLVVSVTLASVVGLFIYLLFSQSRAPSKIIEELADNAPKIRNAIIANFL